MKKKSRIWAVLLTVLISFGSMGCGAKEEAPQEPASQEISIDLNALREAMLSADTTLPDMKLSTSDDVQAELAFGGVSDFAYDRIGAYFYAFAPDGGAQEIVVVELRDASDAAACMDSFHDHIEFRRGVLAEYAPDQIQLLDSAVITRSGKYVTLIISEKSGLVQQAFKGFFE
ncbi:MAG: DUF4358 domain-containing protein [bacterium]|nr:DUF4358 domain-containing protein [bacterium]